MHMYSKGWFIKQLKAIGVNKHPQNADSLERYKTYELRNLYYETILG